MPRFFFDTYDGERMHSDDAGLELEDIEAAKAEARGALPDMARETIRDGTHSTFVVSVRNEAGQIVLRVALSLVVEEGDVDG
jgi:hypothetical protein